MNPNHREIPENIWTTREGECVRILGAWIGNNFTIDKPWLPLLAKIEKRLEIWGKSKPTMEARRHIINMAPGGITQYLTQVQEILADIEKKTNQTIRKPGNLHGETRRKRQYALNTCTHQSKKAEETWWT
jgi:hypothetical protein